MRVARFPLLAHPIGHEYHGRRIKSNFRPYDLISNVYYNMMLGDVGKSNSLQRRITRRADIADHGTTQSEIIFIQIVSRHHRMPLIYCMPGNAKDSSRRKR